MTTRKLDIAKLIAIFEADIEVIAEELFKAWLPTFLENNPENEVNIKRNAGPISTIFKEGVEFGLVYVETLVLGPPPEELVDEGPKSMEA